MRAGITTGELSELNAALKAERMTDEGAPIAELRRYGP